MENMIKKPCIGRQKISMSKITNKSHLQVTFSKRRSGLFKKASELTTLCGVEVGIIVFSPANKAFSFGHPDVESIIDRFLAHNSRWDRTANRLVEAHRNANIQELNIELTQVLNQLEVESKRGKVLDEMRKASRKQCWWEAPVDELRLDELLQLRVAIEDLKRKVAEQANKILVEPTSPSPYVKVNASDTRPGEIAIYPSIYSFGYGYGHVHAPFHYCKQLQLTRASASLASD